MSSNVSRQFSTYIRNYMKAYPHIPPEEYPTFEDFDMNRDGLVTFQEWYATLRYFAPTMELIS